MTPSDRIVASEVKLRPIQSLLAERWGIPSDALYPFGHFKTKLLLDYASDLLSKKSEKGKFVLVTGMSPTAAGEGKTTTVIGLTDALNRVAVNATACLREPSLGPCFGMKGGAHGGGRAQVAPLVDINLHFTGDLHAVGTAHNLLASLIDNELFWDNHYDIDPDRVSWRRVIDLNDRALRNISVRMRRGKTRASAFDITAASEVMAILCLANDRNDFRNRLAEIIVGRSRSGDLIPSGYLHGEGAMAVIMNEALHPNLVQSLEHNPIFIHGGPFANIAHGCNSVFASKTALALADVVVTEAGFGADLGAEKFLDIKCRQSGLRPDAVVIVCTVRALKLHGGVDPLELQTPNAAALRQGSSNLLRHVQNLRDLGINPIVSINRFQSDSDAELAEIEAILREHGITNCKSDFWSRGGEGAIDLANAVEDSIRNEDCREMQLVYDDGMSLKEKIEAVAKRIYHAGSVTYASSAEDELAEIEELGYGHLPVCIAKNQYSFSADPKALGAPSGHDLPIRSVRLNSGARFVVVISGSIMTMPGLPREPAAMSFDVSDDNEILGF